MNKKSTATRLLLASLLPLSLSLSLISGCTQMPTEKQSVSEMRPQITYRVANVDRHAARVLVDGLDMGTVSSYLEGAAALRVIPGTHQLKVVQGNQVLLDENFYAGEGVNRTFIVQ